MSTNPIFQQNQQQQAPQIDLNVNSDTTLVDPITKCKDLLPQLKQSLLVGHSSYLITQHFES